jgi:aminoglycoside phosphotransferase (APT) family kinase protein
LRAASGRRQDEAAVLDNVDVIPYLLERDLISARAVVDGGVRIVDVSRRNRVFIVSADGEPGLVVKQARDADDAGVLHEARVLERLRAGDPRLAGRLPAVVSCDRAASILVVDAARDGHDLRARHERGRFSRELAAQVGRTLALLHAMPLATLGDEEAPLDPSWALQLHRPSLKATHHMTGGASELVSTIQGSQELCAALDELHASRRDATVVHGDMRWDNVLVVRASTAASSRRSRLLLVDWESAGRGDPSLDLGAFLGEYLHAWLRSIPIVDPKDPGRLLAHAGLPLSRMRPAIGAFWLSYARHSRAAIPELGRLLRRAASCAAVRVLTCAFEGSLSHHELSGSGRFALQLSANILRRPDEAIAHLLGIDASWTR